MAQNKISLDLSGKIILIGAYNLTGFQDDQLVTSSAGSNGKRMPGVEIHANLVQQFLQALPTNLRPSRFLTTESPLLIFLTLLLLSLLMAVVVARVSVLWGLAATAGGSFSHLRSDTRDQQQLHARSLPSLAGHRPDLLRRHGLSSFMRTVRSARSLLSSGSTSPEIVA